MNIFDEIKKMASFYIEVNSVEDFKTPIPTGIITDIKNGRKFAFMIVPLDLIPCEIIL